ncbi:MAG: aminodeoxychorismate lyase [Pseudomonadota bacterium]
MALPQHWINGSPSERPSPYDRAFRYGDGVFETLRIHRGRAHLWQYHCNRLLCGADRLNIAVTQRQLDAALTTALNYLQSHDVVDAAGRLQLSRGQGEQGYRPSDTEPTLSFGVAAITPWREVPKSVATYLCATRLAEQPALAGLKHCNRLEQVLAANELKAMRFEGEGLQCSVMEDLVCGVSSNIFLVFGNTLLTPAVERCGIAGTVRRAVLEVLSPARDLEVRVGTVTLDDLLRADELILTNALRGIRSVSHCLMPGRARSGFTSTTFTSTTWGDRLREDFFDWCDSGE